MCRNLTIGHSCKGTQQNNTGKVGRCIKTVICERSKQVSGSIDLVVTISFITFRIITEQSIEWNSSLYVNFVDLFSGTMTYQRN